MSEVHLLDLSDNNNYPYQIVHSKRAKYVRIKLSNRGDLSVVLPKGVSPKFAHNFIRSKACWVEKNLLKMPVEIKKLAPETLDLKLLGECWAIEYQTNDNNYEGLNLKESLGSRLIITGNKKTLANAELLYKSLNQWCKQKAKKVFNQMLENLAEQHGFHYQRLSIRAQKTRWGSCSSNKNINLNAKLLFMPEEVVSYVMLHELCHTIEMNHSQRFWSLVEECDPHYRNHRKYLKKLGKEIVL